MPAQIMLLPVLRLTKTQILERGWVKSASAARENLVIYCNVGS